MTCCLCCRSNPEQALAAIDQVTAALAAAGAIGSDHVLSSFSWLHAHKGTFKGRPRNILQAALLQPDDSHVHKSARALQSVVEGVSGARLPRSITNNRSQASPCSHCPMSEAMAGVWVAPSGSAACATHACTGNSTRTILRLRPGSLILTADAYWSCLQRGRQPRRHDGCDGLSRQDHQVGT